jgi:CheY-like chemotaxis protein
MKSLKLLLIDDDRDDHEMFAHALATFSKTIELYTALNGEIAIDKLLKENLQPDLIILDLNMPLMNGEQFIAELQRHASLRTIPIVVLSTSVSRIEFHADINIKAFIAKPDTMNGWNEKLKSVFDLIGAS